MAKNMEIALLFDFYGDMLTDKQRDVVELYYNDDLSLAEIAENGGITRQGVRDSIKRAESQLLEMEERLGLARRFREMREGLDSIRDAAVKSRSSTAASATPVRFRNGRNVSRSCPRKWRRTADFPL